MTIDMTCDMKKKKKKGNVVIGWWVCDVICSLVVVGT